MDEIFRALADPSRRRLLDLLNARDGRTLRELQVHLTMTRFGVMSHLRVLEAAGLITSRKSGRDKLHFLARDRIREVQEGWFASYGETLLAEPSVPPEGVPGPPAQVFVTYLRATSEQCWAALTTPAMTRGYYYGNSIESTFEPGAAYAYINEFGRREITGTVLVANPPKRLEMTFEARWRADVAAEAPSRVSFDIEPDGALCRLTMTHEVPMGTLVRSETAGGWPYILSGLKTLLETGEKMGF